MNKPALISQICLSSEYFKEDINEIDRVGNTPLMLALKQEKKDCVRILCEFGADPKL